MGENIVAQSEKDDFNFDDFQYSGVKLSPVPDLAQDAPEAEAAAPAPAITEAAAPDVEEAAPPEAAEKADKKAKKKAKKEKPVKAKKEKVVVAASEKRESAFLKKLSEASPYTVLLGMTVVVLLIAVVLLLTEMGSYDFNIHPPKSL
ncbi:MAG: hypothetical protein IT426_02625 [Pirellulales bacterium]|nr:hypothetical protein [Pirellulales bacterium]